MKNQEMIDEMRAWVRANAVTLRNAPVLGKLRRSEIEDETLTPPLYKAGFDLKSDKILAAFTVWGTGELQVIIMDNETAKELVIDDRFVERPRDIYPVFDHYCHQIMNGGPYTKYQNLKTS